MKCIVIILTVDNDVSTYRRNVKSSKNCSFKNHPKKLGKASLNIQIKLCRIYPEFINFGTNVAIYVCLCLFNNKKL